MVLKDTITTRLETGSFASVGGGKGADVLQFSGAGAFANSIVGGGQGADSIRVGRAAIATVAGGGLADQFVWLALLSPVVSSLVMELV